MREVLATSATTTSPASNVPVSGSWCELSVAKIRWRGSLRRWKANSGFSMCSWKATSAHIRTGSPCSSVVIRSPSGRSNQASRISAASREP